MVRATLHPSRRGGAGRGCAASLCSLEVGSGSGPRWRFRPRMAVEEHGGNRGHGRPRMATEPAPATVHGDAATAENRIRRPWSCPVPGSVAFRVTPWLPARSEPATEATEDTEQLSAA